MLSLVGTVNIPIIYKSVDWWYSLHQPASIRFTGGSTMHSQMLQPLLVMIVGFYLFYALAVLLALRSEILEREESARWLEDLVSGKSKAAV